MEQKQVKPLDKFAVNIGEHLRAKGYNLTAMTDELTKQGYTTTAGDKLDTTTVSVFLCANGAKAEPKAGAFAKGSPEAHAAMAKIRAKRFEGLVAKPLDRTAFETIAKPVREAGGTMAEVCEALTAAGYTKKSGRALCAATASHFLIACGMRTYEAKGRRPRQHRFPKVASQVKQGQGRRFPRSEEISYGPPAATKTTAPESADLLQVVLGNKTLTKQQKISMVAALLEQQWLLQE